MDKVRCPACRGAKKVIKLGGMMGDCSTCDGEGTVESSAPFKGIVIIDTPFCTKNSDRKKIAEEFIKKGKRGKKKKVNPTRSVDNGNVQCASTDTRNEAESS